MIKKHKLIIIASVYRGVLFDKSMPSVKSARLDGNNKYITKQKEESDKVDEKSRWICFGWNDVNFVNLTDE